MINSLFFTLALPLLLVLFSIEEYLTFNRQKISLFRLIGNEFYNRNVFLYAISILNIAVIVTVAFNYIHTSYLLHALTVIIFFSLFINAILQCLGSLYLRKLLSGTITSAVLIVPFSLYIFIVAHRDMYDGVMGAVNYFFVSVIVLCVAVFLCLWCGFFMDKLVGYFKR